MKHHAVVKAACARSSWKPLRELIICKQEVNRRALRVEYTVAGGGHEQPMPASVQSREIFKKIDSATGPIQMHQAVRVLRAEFDKLQRRTPFNCGRRVWCRCEGICQDAAVATIVSMATAVPTSTHRTACLNVVPGNSAMGTGHDLLLRADST